MLQTFNFCIGRPWKKDEPSISVYAIGGVQVNHGTTEDAKRCRDIVQKITGEEYFIYQLVQVPE